MSVHVLFEVDGSAYALPADEVLQMESFTGATHVPGAPSHVVGLVHVRGRLVPVVDLRLRFGLPKVDSTIDSRIVVVEREGRTVGFLVDRAREVIELLPSAFEPPPDVIARSAKGYITSVARADKRLIMRIDAAKVIGEENLDAK